MNRKLQTALGVAAIAIATQAAAQITFYEGEGFRGRSFGRWRYSYVGSGSGAGTSTTPRGSRATGRTDEMLLLMPRLLSES